MRVDPQDVSKAARVFKVLSHPDRLRLACSLMDGRKTTESALIDEIGWPQSTMNRHLQILRDADLLKATRSGNTVLLELRSPLTVALMQTMCNYLHQAEDTPVAGDQGVRASAPATSPARASASPARASTSPTRA